MSFQTHKIFVHLLQYTNGNLFEEIGEISVPHWQLLL